MIPRHNSKTCHQHQKVMFRPLIFQTFASHFFRILSIRMIPLLIFIAVASIIAHTPAAARDDAQQNPLSRLWSWAGTSEAADAADTATSDEISEGLDEIANQIKNTAGDSRAIEGLEAGKAELIRGSRELNTRHENLLREQKNLQETTYRSYKAERSVNPNLTGPAAARRVDATANYRTRSRLLKSSIAEVQKDIALNTKSQGTLNTRIDQARKAPNFMGKLKGLAQNAGKMLTLMDVAGAVGRVGSDMADVFDGTGRLQSVLERIIEEGGRMKAVSVGSAAGAGAGALAGPLSPIAAPLLAMAGGAKASEMYEETVSRYLENKRQYLADERARSRFEVEAEKLAETRAANRARTAIANRRSEIEARGREYSESLKYLDDMRTKIAAMYERDRIIEEKARKEQAAKGTVTSTVPAKAAAPVKRTTPIRKSPTVSSSGTITRTYANEVNQITLTVSGVDLIGEGKTKRTSDTNSENGQLYTLYGGELRLAARGTNCTITIRYTISGIEPGIESTWTKVDFLELTKDWDNVGEIKYDIAKSPVYRGAGAHSGDLSIPLTVNQNIKKYMIFTNTPTEFGEVVLSVLIVASENRSFLED
ncbi:MAG: hypothetical protein CVV64_18120 [Candidatus Wallbacteria bacterium HGW-Wallbacteria-1]|jgi:hypothetical protein|uniref:Uncharacterized protein n=1 Tax=Candidatus Wallbacteria bacterium HGW-Wallbacteria-1 TaxID=2013854 RepID=A0A2N1PJV3_9BACT|nr:MAG: hypothetical protein CVV64_18120 [Candidatus Wallbacteria bacterium HGW-Wallbacteria-1]